MSLPLPNPVKAYINRLANKDYDVIGREVILGKGVGIFNADEMDEDAKIAQAVKEKGEERPKAEAVMEAAAKR